MLLRVIWLVKNRWCQHAGHAAGHLVTPSCSLSGMRSVPLKLPCTTRVRSSSTHIGVVECHHHLGLLEHARQRDCVAGVDDLDSNVHAVPATLEHPARLSNKHARTQHTSQHSTTQHHGTRIPSCSHTFQQLPANRRSMQHIAKQLRLTCISCGQTRLCVHAPTTRPAAHTHARAPAKASRAQQLAQLDGLRGVRLLARRAWRQQLLRQLPAAVVTNQPAAGQQQQQAGAGRIASQAQ